MRLSDAGVLALVLVIVVATVAAGALAPSPGPPAALSPAADPACLEWSDGCIVCRRHAGATACSTPGIACTRRAAACERRAGD